MIQGNSKHYRANGKLLLTGEYVVMDGASALAIPLKFGQELTVSEQPDHIIEWKASDVNGIWFKGQFESSTFKLITSSNNRIAEELQRILIAAGRKTNLSPTMDLGKGIKISTYLDYNRYFGFGSSSTLIALIADLFNINEYSLHREVSSGSGYDVVCARHNSPFIFRRLTELEATAIPVNIDFPFMENLYIIWLEEKMYTAYSVQRYRSGHLKELASVVKKINEITYDLLRTTELSTFVKLISEHEKLISSLIKSPIIKEERFNDFNGGIKSLGAWGGDCILACSEMDKKEVIEYFAARDYNTVYCLKDIVLNEKVINHDEINIRF